MVPAPIYLRQTSLLPSCLCECPFANCLRCSSGLESHLCQVVLDEREMGNDVLTTAQRLLERSFFTSNLKLKAVSFLSFVLCHSREEKYLYPVVKMFGGAHPY